MYNNPNTNSTMDTLTMILFLLSCLAIIAVFGFGSDAFAQDNRPLPDGISYQYSQHITAADVAERLQLDSEDVTVTRKGSEVYVTFNRELAAPEKQQLDSLLSGRIPRGTIDRRDSPSASQQDRENEAR